MEKEEIGVINEVGDLGLGFYPVNEEDRKIIKENNENKEA